jgi:hypothetical protein
MEDQTLQGNQDWDRRTRQSINSSRSQIGDKNAHEDGKRTIVVGRRSGGGIMQIKSQVEARGNFYHSLSS